MWCMEGQALHMCEGGEGASVVEGQELVWWRGRS